MQVSATPGLFPAFTTSVSDYVDRCDGTTPVQVSITAPAGVTVSVAGQPAMSGTFTAQVTQNVGQSFTIAVSPPSPSTYYVRCLPVDFPTWTVQKSGTPQAGGYVVARTGSKYPAIFDTNGVPVWWGVPPSTTLFADLLPDGNFGWITYPTGGLAEERGLNGSLVHTINPAIPPNPATPADGHDMVALPGGHYIIVVQPQVPNINLHAAWDDPSSATSAFPTSAPVLDPVVEEVDSGGNVVGTPWDTMAHIPLTSTDPPWRVSTQIDPPSLGGAYDPYHWNSIERTTEANGDPGFVLSFRHLDAVYNVDQTTGNIVWKLGGTPESSSLSVQGDPVFTGGSGGLSGQHDARVLSDGTVTLFDDGTIPRRAPRSVRYQINTSTKTATLLDQVSDPSLVPLSICCGSTRRLPGGNWVTGWGGTAFLSELTPAGAAVFTLQFTSGTGFVYRAVPVPGGQLDRAALRAGMDAQYSVVGAAHTPTPSSGLGPFVDKRSP